MALLGCGGQVYLKREAPQATVVQPDSIHVGSNSIYVRNPAYWSGDQVTLTCDSGLPIDTSSNGPDAPDGYGTYAGSVWTIGTNRDHIANNADDFYTSTDADQFYMRQQEAGLTTSINYFIYRDKLDRLSFYTSRAAALNGATNQRITLYKVDFNGLIISPSGSAEYQNAIALCAGDVGEYSFSDTQDEITLDSICDYAPTYTLPAATNTEYDNAEITPRSAVNTEGDGTLWTIQADLSEWTLNLSAPEVDTTAVGERFGNSVKSIITGGGTMDFLVERRDTGDNERDSTQLMRLLLLTEKGCKADAQFWMAKDRTAVDTILPGDLYYETQLLVTSIAINTRAGDVIAGSLNFVTVDEVALRMGTN